MQNWKKFSRVLFLIALLAGVSTPKAGNVSVSAAPAIVIPILNCPTAIIDQWTFTGNATTSSPGNGTLIYGTGLNAPSFPDGNPNPSISFSGWTADATARVTEDYLEFSVNTTGIDYIGFGFDYRSTSSGPGTLELHYSTDGTNFTLFGSPITLTKDSAFHTHPAVDLSPITGITKFRIYAYGASSTSGTFNIDNVTLSELCILPYTGVSGDISIVNKVNNSDIQIDSNVCATVVFTLAVTNNGASPISDVLVKDVLPSGQLEYVSHTSGMKYYPPSGIWWIDSLAGNTTQILTITAKVMATGVIANQAEVLFSSNLNAIDISNINSIVGNSADLSIDHDWLRSDSAADTAELAITVTNTGPDDAAGVQVEDLLPTGLKYVSYTSVPSGTGITYSSSTGIWSVGNLLSGDAAKLTINAKVDAGGTSTTNTAKIYRSNQCDLDLTNNEASDDVQVADLSLTETVVINSSKTTAVFTLTVFNGDADSASGVKVKIPFAGYDPIADNGGGTFAYDTSNIYDTNDVWIWDVGVLPKNSSRALVVTTEPLAVGAFPENWAQIVDVIEVDPDSVPNNCDNTVLDCKEDDDAGAPSADLRLEQIISSPAPYVNSEINTTVKFRITVTNDGYADATGVEVKDLLPSGLTYSSHTLSVGSYTKGTGIWVVGGLPSGADEILEITASVSSYGLRTNWAEIWQSGQSDSDSQPGDGSTTDDDDAEATVTSYRSVVINEVAWSGTAASADDEWLELYNPSNADITLTGWKIRKSSCDVSLGTDYILLANSAKILKDGYFLLERGSSSADNSTVSDISANQIYLATELSNSGEVLYLCDNFNNFIDTANKNGGAWPKGNSASPFGSMERVGITVESDSSWVTNLGVTRNGKNASRGDIYGTPGRGNSSGVAASPTPTNPVPTAIPLVGRPIINEFLSRPGYDWNLDGKVNVFDEFIEVKNIGVADVNLGGWVLDDEANLGSAPFTLPDINLKPGQRTIFYGLQTNILLSDGGDTVRLLNSSNKVYDSYTYAITKVEDQSVCRLPDGNGSWYEDCIPTPNLTNSREGFVPSMPGGEVFESPVCELPDTLPADFLFAECRGYGADIWHSFYWDEFGWQGDRAVRESMTKWESFVE